MGHRSGRPGGRPRSRLLYAALADRRVARWKALDDSLGVYLPGYPVTAPTGRLTVDLVLDSSTAARKVRALAAQETQTAGLIAAMGVDCYTAWVGEESFVQQRPQPTCAERPAGPVMIE